MKNICIISSKLSKILEVVKKSEGLIYIFSRFNPAGVIPMALALEQNGFDRYTVEGEKQLLLYLKIKIGGGKGKDML